MLDKLFFRPINENHSIKESVIALLTANPFLKPERFQSLIETEFKDFFQKIDLINDFRVEINPQLSVNQTTINARQGDIAGVRFSSFEKGKIEKVLQIMNEAERKYISYHLLNYSNWELFYSDFIKYAKVISANSEAFVNGVTLHYLDQFIWEGDGQIDFNFLLKKDAEYLPQEFWKGNVKEYLITTERVIQSKAFLDRLEIKVDDTVDKIVLISHNMFLPFYEPIPLEKMLNSSDLKEILDAAHTHNKEILKDVLLSPITHSINLTY